jgi:hypothetical protein
MINKEDKPEDEPEDKPRISVKNLLSRFEQNAVISTSGENRRSSQSLNTSHHASSLSSNLKPDLKSNNHLSADSSFHLSCNFAGNDLQSGTKPPSKPLKPNFLNQRVRSVTVTTSASPSFSQKDKSIHSPTSAIHLQPPSSLKGNILSKSTPNLNAFNNSSIMDEYDDQYKTSIPLATSADNRSKIQMIKNEIFTTELSYYSDLMILNDLYAQRLRNQEHIIPTAEWKLLFSGLHGVITTCYALIQSMITNTIIEPLNDSYQYSRLGSGLLSFSPNLNFGLIFTQHIKHIEVSYSKYCKNNEAALLKVL